MCRGLFGYSSSCLYLFQGLSEVMGWVVGWWRKTSCILWRSLDESHMTFFMRGELGWLVEEVAHSFEEFKQSVEVEEVRF